MERIFGTLIGRSLRPAADPLKLEPAHRHVDGQVPRATVRISPHVPLFPFDERHWRAAEQYRIIRTKLVQHPLQPRLLVISSAAHSDGKTINAANIAAAMALKRDHKVLLVDADFRRSHLAELLGVPAGPGLAGVLAGRCSLDQAILHLDPGGLYFLPAGDDRTTPVELLDSARWAATCATVRKDFNFVFLDSPPIGLVADYDLLVAVSDGVIVVVRPEYTNRTQFFRALNMVPEQKLVGVVVNCAQPSLFWRARDYYYNYY